MQEWHRHNLRPSVQTYAPGINLDEVQRNCVCARGQVLVRLLDVVRLGLGVVTTTDLAKSAACRDLDTVEALEVFVVLEVGGDRLEFAATATATAAAEGLPVERQSRGDEIDSFRRQDCELAANIVVHFDFTFLADGEHSFFCLILTPT